MSPFRVVLLGLLAAVLGSVAILDKVAPTDCGEAKSLLKDGLVKPADAAYTEVLKDDPSSKCATTGLREVAEARCKRAKRVLATKSNDEATKAFVALLASEPPEPAFTCGVDGLAMLAETDASGGETQTGATCSCVQCPSPTGNGGTGNGGSNGGDGEGNGGDGSTEDGATSNGPGTDPPTRDGPAKDGATSTSRCRKGR